MPDIERDSLYQKLHGHAQLIIEHIRRRPEDIFIQSVENTGEETVGSLWVVLNHDFEPPDEGDMRFVAVHLCPQTGDLEIASERDQRFPTTSHISNLHYQTAPIDAYNQMYLALLQRAAELSYEYGKDQEHDVLSRVLKRRDGVGFPIFSKLNWRFLVRRAQLFGTPALLHLLTSKTNIQPEPGHWIAVMLEDPWEDRRRIYLADTDTLQVSARYEDEIQVDYTARQELLVKGRGWVASRLQEYSPRISSLSVPTPNGYQDMQIFSVPQETAEAVRPFIPVVAPMPAY